MKKVAMATFQMNKITKCNYLVLMNIKWNDVTGVMVEWLEFIFHLHFLKDTGKLDHVMWDPNGYKMNHTQVVSSSVVHQSGRSEDSLTRRRLIVVITLWLFVQVIVLQ